MELNNLLTKTAVCDVQYDDYAFKVNVFTQIMTPEYKARLLALGTASESVKDDEGVEPEVKDEHAQLLADLIESWTDKDGEAIVLGGEPFPPTYENWLKLPYQMIAAFTKQITIFIGDQVNPQNATA